jgi:NTP pyrophosphatase (non-canonical NTP hydrolase)
MHTDTSRLTVTLIGSFRHDKAKLQQQFNYIHANFTLLSPVSIDFTSEDTGFVKTDVEAKLSVTQIEQKHLEAIKSSDFIFLHAPSGYVGLSGAAEIGYANALGIPIFADELPTDITIQTFIAGLINFDGTLEVQPRPGQGLAALQIYYQRIAERRGWSEETPKDTLLLITEEIGELARAIRKTEGIRRDGSYDDDSVAEELADVQLYLVHLANGLHINLSDAVNHKEAINHKRYIERSLE